MMGEPKVWYCHQCNEAHLSSPNEECNKSKVFVTNTPRAGESAGQSKARTREARDAHKIETPVLGTQIGGDHYTSCTIQPVEFIWANNLGFSEGNIVKYAARWKKKGGIKDLEKIAHHANLLIEWARAEEKRTGIKFGLQSV